jgi:alkylated DNA nucleotide flippase Atl1
VPAIASEKLERVSERPFNFWRLPYLRVVNRDGQIKLASPSQPRPPFGAVAKLGGRCQQKEIIGKRLPRREEVRLEMPWRKSNMIINAARQPAGARMSAALDDVDFY